MSAGLRAIAALRRRGQRPRHVWVYLVADDVPADPWPLDTLTGGATVDIPARIGVSDIDYRPLTGLHVLLRDLTGDPKRLHRMTRAITEVEPEQLTVFSDVGMHRKFRGATGWETMNWSAA